MAAPLSWLMLIQMTAFFHDDVIKWKHFPRYWPFVRGIHRSPVNSPHKVQWRGALMFSLICAWITRWVNNHKAGDLRPHPAYYDVTVMLRTFCYRTMENCISECIISWRWFISCYRNQPRKTIDDAIYKHDSMHAFIFVECMGLYVISWPIYLLVVERSKFACSGVLTHWHCSASGNDTLINDVFYYILYACWWPRSVIG